MERQGWNGKVIPTIWLFGWKHKPIRRYSCLHTPWRMNIDPSLASRFVLKPIKLFETSVCKVVKFLLNFGSTQIPVAGEREPTNKFRIAKLSFEMFQQFNRQ